MAKQVLVPGKSLEIPTVEEIQAVLGRDRDAQRDDRLLRTSENVLTDGAGAARLDQIYIVPQGFEARLYRWSIPNVDGNTPGTLFNSAAGWVELQIDEQRVDWFSLVAAAGGGIPAKMTWSTLQGPIASSGQRIGIVVSGGPLNTNLETRIQGILVKADSGRYR